MSSPAEPWTFVLSVASASRRGNCSEAVDCQHDQTTKPYNGDTLIDWDAIRLAVSQITPPYFFGTLAAAAFGAFAGGWVNSRIQTKKAIVTELNGVGATAMLCFSICNSAIGLKRQFITPMRDAYARARHERVQAALAAKYRAGQNVFNYQLDLKIIMQPKMPTELLERYIFDRVSIRGRGLAAAVQLVASIDGLGKTIKFRNDIIEEFHKANYDEKTRAEKYFGLQTAFQAS